MENLIRQEIRNILNEMDNGLDHRENNNDCSKEELVRLRTFHYNVHHLVYHPIADITDEVKIRNIKKLLDDFEWS